MAKKTDFEQYPYAVVYYSGRFNMFQIFCVRRSLSDAVDELNQCIKEKFARQAAIYKLDRFGLVPDSPVAVFKVNLEDEL
jgi:hypothetical protein